MKSLVVFLYRFLRKEGIDVSGADVDKYHYEINFLPKWGAKITHKQ